MAQKPPYNKKRGGQPQEPRTEEKRPHGKQANGKRTAGQRPTDGRPEGKRDGKRPQGQYPAGNRPEPKRPPQPSKPYREGTTPDPEAQANWICGKNAVLEALRSEQSVNRVVLADNLTGGFGTEVIKLSRALGVPYHLLPRTKLTQLAGPDNRGVACELAAFQYAEVESMLARAEAKGEMPLLVLLDGVEDPHNLGAVIRTALCVGAHGVIIPKRRSASLNATVLKTSAGAATHLPVARVSNLSQTAQMLKEQGLWLAAADMDGQTAWTADLSGPLALVLGSEGQGVSPGLKKQCDYTVSLPLKGAVSSLNVSAAAAAILYEICRQRSSR